MTQLRLCAPAQLLLFRLPSPLFNSCQPRQKPPAFDLLTTHKPLVIEPVTHVAVLDSTPLDLAGSCVLTRISRLCGFDTLVKASSSANSSWKAVA
ncbi:hypothetical protein DTO271G3_7709 [Paecilomyces variotii]|nr:hypothetical protein DTO271G3_7709 [Paecilomyces variotii]